MNEYVVQQIEYLIELLQKVYKGQKKFLFPDNYLEVQDILDKARNDNKIEKSQLIRMNYIFRKTKAHEECIEKHGELMTYDQWVEWNVTDILTDESIKNGHLKTAAEFVRRNYLQESGEFYDITKAKKFVEQIRDNGSIIGIEDENTEET